MAWDREIVQNQLFDFFSFYATNGVGGANGSIKETITGGDAGETEVFRIEAVRVMCSEAVASIEDLIIKLKSGKGSAHDVTFLSHPMSDSTYVIWYPSDSMWFMSGDTVSVYFSLNSGANQIGICVQGWAVQG